MKKVIFFVVVGLALSGTANALDWEGALKGVTGGAGGACAAPSCGQKQITSLAELDRCINELIPCKPLFEANKWKAVVTGTYRGDDFSQKTTTVYDYLVSKLGVGNAHRSSLADLSSWCAGTGNTICVIVEPKECAVDTCASFK